MRIAGLKLFSYRLPLRKPIAIKGQTIEARSGLLVSIVTDSGLTGWGEIAPLEGFSRETLESAREEALRLRPAIQGSEVLDHWTPMQDDLSFLPHVRDWSPSVRFGIELALWNIRLEAGQITSPKETGQPGCRLVFLNGLLAGKADAVTDQARALVGAGYRAVKLKVGGKPLREEIRLTRSVRDVIGEGVALRLDANRSWGLDEAVEFGRAVREFKIDYIEEPLADPSGMTPFYSASGLPVALDETLLDTPIDKLGDLQGIKAVVLKATLLGGFHTVFKLAVRARNLGLQPVVSSTFESGIGIVGLARLAAEVSGGIPVGLDTYRWLDQDVLVPRIETGYGCIDLLLLEKTRHEVNPAMLQEVSDG